MTSGGVPSRSAGARSAGASGGANWMVVMACAVAGETMRGPAMISSVWPMRRRPANRLCRHQDAAVAVVVQRAGREEQRLPGKGGDERFQRPVRAAQIEVVLAEAGQAGRMGEDMAEGHRAPVERRHGGVHEL